MIDELSNSRFWLVKTLDTWGASDSFYVQTCPSKDAEYVEKIIESVHPEYEHLRVEAAHRPAHLKRCYGDP